MKSIQLDSAVKEIPNGSPADESNKPQRSDEEPHTKGHNFPPVKKNVKLSMGKRSFVTHQCSFYNVDDKLRHSSVDARQTHRPNYEQIHIKNEK